MPPSGPNRVFIGRGVFQSRRSCVDGPSTPGAAIARWIFQACERPSIVTPADGITHSTAWRWPPRTERESRNASLADTGYAP